MIRVMVSLDLMNAEPRRDDFYKLLATKGWVKLAHVDTVWTFSTPGHSKQDELNAMADIAEVLTEAAIEFKPTRINYVAQIGNNVAIERVVEKRRNQYCAFDAV
ncbi:hypothetical protein [Pseudomonas sp. MF7453]|uniref:hypothetical protein n=1 Tax=Pseudomonas sp. MF7453 TaxID=2797539 RepID=UPI0018E73D5D|nr:hypothetical protein [Pseudomonas sp. MF7453]MBJ2219617.1 hypothetical protein [Pseudomonas sp. MF7453]